MNTHNILVRLHVWYTRRHGGTLRWVMGSSLVGSSWQARVCRWLRPCLVSISRVTYKVTRLISHTTLSRFCLVAVTYKSVGSTQDGRGKSGNKSL
jgi:hypothetical protein